MQIVYEKYLSSAAMDTFKYLASLSKYIWKTVSSNCI